ncbi:outer envelope pore protein 16, chloroplastic [Dorcoceras hygrometricum]|uniref:Outer envelope pore protein 16, chloroplastic n=2 Tax=Dorcoceras hygrometricum TaxID=472368 RepID=A0A2Z7A8S0_9LAMI|nr:outer envelope pore protein 16, chloroplastic [Dorcoceras hygrometricum]
MPEGISGSLSSPKVDVMVDLGNPYLNLAVDGFLKIGAVRGKKIDPFHYCLCYSRVSVKLSLLFCVWLLLRDSGSISSEKVEYSLKRMCREGASWGAVAGVYVGVENGVEKLRGIKDWKNAAISGALTGAVLSAATNRNRDKIVLDAITGGAVATAAEFLNHLT